MEKVFLKEFHIRADEFVSWGMVPCTRVSDSFCRTQDIIFTTVNHCSESEKVCVISRIERVCHNEYTHKVISYLENTNGDITTSSEAGWYMNVSFYTDRKEHMNNIYAAYMSVLKTHNTSLVNSSNIEYFHRQHGKIVCDLYIPVNDN